MLDYIEAMGAIEEGVFGGFGHVHPSKAAPVVAKARVAADAALKSVCPVGLPSSRR